MGRLQEKDLHPDVKKFNWIGFCEDRNDFEKSFEKLLETLDRHADYVKNHTRFLIQALTWEQQEHKLDNHLLPSEDLDQAKDWLTKRFNDQAPCEPTELHCRFIAESIKKSQNDVTQAFLAHADKNADTMRKVRHSLQRQGITVWSSDKDIQAGREFPDAIDRGIEQADNVVYMLSPASLQSEYCQRELDYALSLNKRIIPILVDPVEDAEIPKALRNIQYVDLTDNNDDKDYRKDEIQLLNRLLQDADYLRNHTKWLQKAIEWQDSKRNKGYLLGEKPYNFAEEWLAQAEKENKQPPPTDLQKEFIQTSQAAIIAAHKREKRLDRILKCMLGLSIMTSAGLAVLGGFAWYQKNLANRFLEDQINAVAQSSLILSDSNQAFDSLLAVLRIGHEQSTLGKFKLETEELVRRALWHALSKPMEKSRIEEHTDKIRDFAFSPDSQVFATASDDGTARLWSLTGKALKTLPHKFKAYGVHFSPDGELIVTRGSDQVISLWDKDGNPIKSIDGQTVDLGIGFSDDSEYFIAKSTADKAILWTKAGEEVASFPHAKLAGFQINQQSGRVMTRSQDGVAKLWTLTGDAVKTFQYSDYSASRLSPDGRWVAFFGAAADDIPQILMVNVETGEESAWDHDAPINRLSFSRDNRFFITYQWRGNSPVTVWNFDGEILNQFDYGAEVNGVSLSSESQMLAVAGRSGLVKLWSLQGDELHSFVHTEPVENVLFSSNGKHLATVSGEHSIKLWSIKNPFVIELGTHQDWASRVRFDPAGKTIVTTSFDHTARLWQPDGQLLKTLRGHTDRVRAVGYSPKGDRIATGSRDKTIRLWSRTGQPLRVFSNHDDAVVSVAFSPNPAQDLLLAVTNSGTLYAWNQSGELLFQKQGEYRPVFAPNGDFFITANGPDINIWRPNGTFIRRLKGHDDALKDLAISPDSQMIGSAGQGERIRFFTIWHSFSLLELAL